MREFLRKNVPLIRQLGTYDADAFRGDVAAGVTVGVMLIPQGMAYALIAGLPPVHGLYAALLPPLLYALFGSSRHLSVGPTALVSLLVASGVAPLVDGNPQRYVVLAMCLAALVGLIQMGMAFIRVGVLTDFLSEPVLTGFSAAAALIIGLSQLEHLLGVSLPQSEYIYVILAAVFESLGQVHLLTVALGVGGIVLIEVVERWWEALPSSLIAVVAATVAVWLFDLKARGVAVVGEVPGGLPRPGLALFPDALDGASGGPLLRWSDLQALLPSALAIALVGFAVAVAVGKVYASRHRYEIDGTQELVGLGLANIGGAFFQGYPVTGSFSRTAVNDATGGQTTLAGVVGALLIGGTLLVLTPLFAYLPNAVLASIVMVAVVRLVDLERIRFLWNAKRSDFWLLVFTFGATLLLGIEEGILGGIIVSLILVIQRSFRPNITIMGRLPDSDTFADIERHPKALTRSDVVVIRMESSLYFANAQLLKDRIMEVMAQDDALRMLVVDAYPVNRIDGTAAYMLRDVVEVFQEQGYRFFFAGVKGEAMDVLRRAGIVELLGEEAFFQEVTDAVTAATEAGERPAHKAKDDLRADVAGTREISAEEEAAGEEL